MKMEKLDCPIWETSPAIGITLREMAKKINELIEQFNNMQSSVTKKTPCKPKRKKP